MEPLPNFSTGSSYRAGNHQMKHTHDQSEEENHEIVKTHVIYSVLSENHGSRTPPWGSPLGLI